MPSVLPILLIWSPGLSQLISTNDMMKMCAAHLSALLLACFLLSSQMAEAQTSAKPGNLTQASPVSLTTHNMTSKDKNGSGVLDGITVLLPLALAAPLLHSWSL